MSSSSLLSPKKGLGIRRGPGKTFPGPRRIPNPAGLTDRELAIDLFLKLERKSADTHKVLDEADRALFNMEIKYDDLEEEKMEIDEEKMELDLRVKKLEEEMERVESERKRIEMEGERIREEEEKKRVEMEEEKNIVAEERRRRKKVLERAKNARKAEGMKEFLLSDGATAEDVLASGISGKVHKLRGFREKAYYECCFRERVNGVRIGWGERERPTRAEVFRSEFEGRYGVVGDV